MGRASGQRRVRPLCSIKLPTGESRQQLSQVGESRMSCASTRRCPGDYAYHYTAENEDTLGRRRLGRFGVIAARLITMPNIVRASYPIESQRSRSARRRVACDLPRAPPVGCSDAIELFGADEKRLASRAVLRFAEVYEGLNRSCEATTPINMWLSLDPASRDTSRSQRIISDCEAKGNCASSNEFRKTRQRAREDGPVVRNQVS